MDLWTVENSRIVHRKWELGDDPDLLLLPHGPMTEKQARTTRPRKESHSILTKMTLAMVGASLLVYIIGPRLKKSWMGIAAKNTRKKRK